MSCFSPLLSFGALVFCDSCYINLRLRASGICRFITIKPREISSKGWAKIGVFEATSFVNEGQEAYQETLLVSEFAAWPYVFNAIHVSEMSAKNVFSNALL